MPNSNRNYIRQSRVLPSASKTYSSVDKLNTSLLQFETLCKNNGIEIDMQSIFDQVDDLTGTIIRTTDFTRKKLIEKSAANRN